MITPAFAQGAGAAAGGAEIAFQVVPFVLIFVIMYFLILRPQQKRVKDHQALLKSVRRDDTVVTNGGLVGRVGRVEGRLARDGGLDAGGDAEVGERAPPRPPALL